MLIQSYEGRHEKKKATVFTDDQITKFLSEDFKEDQPNFAFWTIHQALFVVGVCGGLRVSELASLKHEHFEETPQGFWFEFIGAKQRGPKEVSHFIVPFNSNLP